MGGIVIAGVVIVGAVLLVAFGPPLKTQMPVREDRIVVGPEDARIVVAEYFDLDCPFCREFNNVGGWMLARKYAQDPVSFAVRHMPLSYLHPNAVGKAMALECVSQQGVPYKNAMTVLYRLSFTSTSSIAADLSSSLSGVDAVELERCLIDKRTEEQVLSAYRAGVEAGVEITPTFILYKDGIERARVIGNEVERLDASIELLRREL